MKVNAILRKYQSSPKKTRLVADKIRGMKVEQALNTLMFVNKKSAMPLLKLVKSAVANAENNFKLKKEDLVLSEIRVDSDGMLKRIMPRARGMAFPILKRISRVEIVLTDGNDVKIEKVEKSTKKTASVKVAADKETNKVTDNK